LVYQKPEPSYERIVQIATRWAKKIEDDVALKRLDAVFSLSETLAEQGNQWCAHSRAPVTDNRSVLVAGFDRIETVEHRITRTSCFVIVGENLP
jgi:hypothetical protein